VRQFKTISKLLLGGSFKSGGLLGESWYKKETIIFIYHLYQIEHMDSKDNGYVRIAVTNEAFDKLAQKKRENAAKAGKDITWDDFLLAAVFK